VNLEIWSWTGADSNNLATHKRSVGEVWSIKWLQNIWISVIIDRIERKKRGDIEKEKGKWDIHTSGTPRWFTPCLGGP
jgi:hypothetical protein